MLYSRYSTTGKIKLCNDVQCIVRKGDKLAGSKWTMCLNVKKQQRSEGHKKILQVCASSKGFSLKFQC